MNPAKELVEMVVNDTGIDTVTATSRLRRRLNATIGVLLPSKPGTKFKDSRGRELLVMQDGSVRRLWSPND